MSHDDRKTLSPEMLPAPERPGAGTPRQRVITQLRRVLSSAVVGGMVASVTSLGCDPAPPPSRAPSRCTCPDGSVGTQVQGVTFFVCNCQTGTGGKAGVTGTGGNAGTMGAGGTGGSQDGGTDGPTDVAGADGVDLSDSAKDGPATDEDVVDVSSEKPFDGSTDVE